MMTANDWIDRLELISHPEGGYFKETMRGDGKGRASFSSIYFLLTQRDISHFHRIDADEVWYYHAGQTLKIHMITPKGEYHTVKLGRDIDCGECLQYCVSKGTIFASTLDSAEGYSLVGCMCQPRFEYEHFELLTQEYLIRQYPQYESIIKRLAISQED
ncbi:cupin domain-containing protein [Staphylococcus epidermidis]|uniref:cupin domain-containing protein n=1 Tax=Staphylococcus epidermidis TaxID=1282 RepID=UPI003F8821E7